MFKIKYLLPPIGSLILLIVVITQFRPPDNLNTGPFLPLIIFFGMLLIFLISIINLFTKNPKLAVSLGSLLTLILILKIFHQYIIIGILILVSLIYLYLLTSKKNLNKKRSQNTREISPPNPKLKKIHRID